MLVTFYTQNCTDGAVYYMSENYVYCICKIYTLKEESLSLIRSILQVSDNVIYFYMTDK